MGHMANKAHRGYGVQGVWSTWAIGHNGYRGMDRVWATWVMGHMGNGAHGQWGTWAMGHMGKGPMGDLHIFAYKIIITRWILTKI